MITMLWLYLTTNGIIMLSGVGGVKIFTPQWQLYARE